MRHTFINSAEDMSWLFSTHLRTCAPEVQRCQSAVVFGNEDSPERVELHWDVNPLANAMPAAVYMQDADGQLRDFRR